MSITRKRVSESRDVQIAEAQRRTPYKDPWPPCCCVAAFVHKALQLASDSRFDRELIARRLNIHVGPRDFNPWNLKTTRTAGKRGIDVDRATRQIPLAFQRLHVDLSFRHIRFCEIVYGMLESVFAEASTKGCIVAFGYDRSILRESARSLRHVVRLERANSRDGAMLLDDSTGDSPPAVFRTWREIEHAARAVDDGFWIIGPQSRKQLCFVPSY